MQTKLKELQAKVLEWWNRYTTKQKTLIITISVGIIFALAVAD